MRWVQNTSTARNQRSYSGQRDKTRHAAHACDPSTWEAGKSRTVWAIQRPSLKTVHNGNNANYSSYSRLYPLFSLIHVPNDHTIPHKHVQFREIITKAHLWVFVVVVVLRQGFLCIALAVLELFVDQACLLNQRFSCLCLSNAGLKCVPPLLSLFLYRPNAMFRSYMGLFYCPCFHMTIQCFRCLCCSFL